MKKIVSLFMILSLMVLAACSMDSGQKDDKKETKDSMEDVKVGVSISTLNNPFFVSLKDGIEKEAKEKGMKVTVVDAQDDTAKQISGIEDLILQKVDILLVNPTDSAQFLQLFNQQMKRVFPLLQLTVLLKKGISKHSSLPIMWPAEK